MSVAQLEIRGVFGFGKATQNADTVITRGIPPKRQANGPPLYTRITSLRYTAAGTAHTLTVMRPFGRTTLTAAANSGQAVVNIAADPTVNAAPGALAANDYVCLQQSDGTYLFTTVSSVAVLAITLNTNLTAAAASGAYFWSFGVVGDGHPQFPLTASTTLDFDDTTIPGLDGYGFIGSDQAFQPLIVHSNNATAQGTIEAVAGCYHGF